MSNVKLVEFETDDKLRLPGLLYEPARKTKKAVIALHGNGSVSYFYKLTENTAFAKSLNSKNMAYFPFNNRGAHYIKSFKRLNKAGQEERTEYGTTFELIKDCILDIDAAIAYLKTLGYSELYLIGQSSGANKICVYNFYKPKNEIKKYALLAPGDDVGIYYQELGPNKFYVALEKAKLEITRGNGRELAPKALFDSWLSYRSLSDYLNSDGDYNTFPFNEALNNLKLSKKPLFRHYQSIKKPTMVVIGANDEYCYERVSEIIELLKKESSVPAISEFKILANADHGFHGQEKALAKIIAEWL